MLHNLTEFNRKKRILIVDDNELCLAILKAQLEGSGYYIDDYLDAEEAFHKFKENPKKYNLVITDLNFPALDFDGFDLCQKIKEISPTTVVISHSASGDVIPRKHNLFDLDFIKPVPHLELHQAIEKYFGPKQ